MPSNHKAKAAARAYQKEHGGDYAAARKATPPPSAVLKRGANASEFLEISTAGVVAALTEALRRRTPTGEVTKGLIAALIDSIDDIPERDDYVHGDLQQILEHPKYIEDIEPPIHEGSQAAARVITELVAGLEDPQLVAAAVDLGVTQSHVDDAVYRAIRRAMPTRFDDTLVLNDEDRRTVQAREEAQQQIMSRLADRSTETWTTVDREILRVVVVESLAELGDLYLTLSEPRYFELLEWHRLQDGTFRADVTIDAAPNALTALIVESRNYESDSASQSEFYQPTHRRGTTGYSCYVGVLGDDPIDVDPRGSNFELFDLVGFTPLPIAQLSGAQMVANIAVNARTVRSYHRREPLIPRSADDCDIIRLGLSETLGAVVDLLYDYPDMELWEPTPHVRVPNAITSITGAVLDACQLPWPKPKDPAAAVSVNSTTFSKYLVRQGVEITELARTYLAGTEDASESEASALTRHTAGALAILSRYELRDIVNEVSQGYPPIKTNVLALGSAELIESHFADLELLSDLMSERPSSP